MGTIRTWADVQAIFAVPGVRPAVIIAALLVAIVWTFARAAAFATSLRQRAIDVWAAEERRNREFEAPDDHQVRWHISHARSDISQAVMLLGSIYVTLRVILAVLIVGVVVAAL
jgi:hypothetical protein